MFSYEKQVRRLNAPADRRHDVTCQSNQPVSFCSPQNQIEFNAPCSHEPRRAPCWLLQLHAC